MSDRGLGGWLDVLQVTYGLFDYSTTKGRARSVANTIRVAAEYEVRKLNEQANIVRAKMRAANSVAEYNQARAELDFLYEQLAAAEKALAGIQEMQGQRPAVYVGAAVVAAGLIFLIVGYKRKK